METIITAQGSVDDVIKDIAKVNFLQYLIIQRDNHISDDGQMYEYDEDDMKGIGDYFLYPSKIYNHRDNSLCLEFISYKIRTPHYIALEKMKTYINQTRMFLYKWGGVQRMSILYDRNIFKTYDNINEVGIAELYDTFIKTCAEFFNEEVPEDWQSIRKTYLSEFITMYENDPKKDEWVSEEEIYNL
jgi:hypothetical protein